MDITQIYYLIWTAGWLFFAFCLGASVGSFLNVCVARLPYEKSLIWPSSRCGSCFQAIAWQDNLPLLGYLRLRGRCRTCGATFSARYLGMELFTGLAFAGLCYLELFANVLHLPTALTGFQGMGLEFTQALPVFFHHATLLSFLIVVSACDLNDMEIPLPVTATGTAVGLVLAALQPWPFPEPVPAAVTRPEVFPPLPGVYPWPVWYPLPAWLPPGSWQLGLATGLAGALAGMLVLRGVRFLFGLGRGIEGMGVGDADLMMMAGAFVGWQPVVIAFFVAVFPALILALVQLVRRGEQALPFGPPLAAGVLITVLGWHLLGAQFRLLFFEPLVLVALVLLGGLLLFTTAFALRIVRGPGEPTQG